MTIREQILQALLVRLSGNTPAGMAVYRSRTAAIDEAQTPAIVVRPVEEAGIRLGSGMSQRDLVVEVRVMVSGDPPDGAADPVAEAVHRLLYADPTIGGLAAALLGNDEAQWEFDDGDRPYCELPLLYRLRYLATAGDLAQPVI